MVGCRVLGVRLLGDWDLDDVANINRVKVLDLGVEGLKCLEGDGERSSNLGEGIVLLDLVFRSRAFCGFRRRAQGNVDLLVDLNLINVLDLWVGALKSLERNEELGRDDGERVILCYDVSRGVDSVTDRLERWVLRKRWGDLVAGLGRNQELLADRDEIGIGDCRVDVNNCGDGDFVGGGELVQGVTANNVDLFRDLACP